MFSANAVLKNQTVTQRSVNVDEKWAAYQRTGDIQIRNELVLEYMGVVRKIAFKIYAKAGFIDSAEELVNEGTLALITAIDRFDLERNVKFETFVSRRVQGAMLDYIHRQTGFVRRTYDLGKTVSAVQRQLAEQLGREPSAMEMAEELSVSLEEYRKMLQEIKPVKVVSLNMPDNGYGEESTAMDIPSDAGSDPAEILCRDDMSENLVRGIQKLSEEQQLVLSLFYKEEFTVREIAQALCTTTEKVSQIRFQAVKKLKKYIGGNT